MHLSDLALVHTFLSSSTGPTGRLTTRGGVRWSANQDNKIFVSAISAYPNSFGPEAGVAGPYSVLVFFLAGNTGGCRKLRAASIFLLRPRSKDLANVVGLSSAPKPAARHVKRKSTPTGY